MGYETVGQVADQLGFRRIVLEAQTKAEEEHQYFVSDRSAIDCWVLWQRWNICEAMSYDTETYYDICRKQAEKYTHIIYVPPMFAPPEDGFRWTDLDYQKQIDRIVRMTLYEWNLWDKTYTVKSDVQHERAREVTQWLRETPSVSKRLAD